MTVNFYFLEYFLVLSPLMYNKNWWLVLALNAYIHYSQNQLPVYKNQTLICLKYNN